MFDKIIATAKEGQEKWGKIEESCARLKSSTNKEEQIIEVLTMLVEYLKPFQFDTSQIKAIDDLISNLSTKE